ncbi:hypothetical protein [Haloarcula sediminis]|uniref:hypothetical protein n=1 Tax=Haloarcula sediminis TaxID=3111777 RepID=UPI002D7A1C95|nr:hypothetical protein [Haloarcula sp. CK38]
MAADNVLTTLAVAALLVLAGCPGGPTSGPDGTTASRPQATDTGESVGSGVTVENGTLPVNATRTFTRVQALTDTDADPWPVRVWNLSERHVGQVGASPLNRALGFRNVSTDRSEPTGVTNAGAVYIHPGDGAPAQTERVLAHEYAHLVQYRTAMLPWRGQLREPRLTTDRLKARRSLVEGGAVFVADAYTERYLDIRSNSAYAHALYRNGSATHRSALAPYVFGSQYVDHRIDDPANLSAAYERYPRTTEQVIHNYSRADEPPASLDVTAGAGSGDWAYLGNNTLGEMTTRSALDTELDRDRAASAAAGWGNDRLTIYRHATDEERDGWAWVLRWDSASEAAELDAALSTYADARDSDSPRTFRVEPIDEETVALVFGDPAFVERATVSGTDGNVRVGVGA